MVDSYTYIIVGAGVAGASAVEGIRATDGTGSLLLIGNEEYLPYHRPPLSKGLWTGEKNIEDIFVHGGDYYDRQRVAVALGAPAVSLDLDRHLVADSLGHEYRYGKLLLATGGFPRALRIPGGDAEGICYYRYLDDYRRIRRSAREGMAAVVVGGGLVGAELAPALARNGVGVTMVFPEEYVGARLFPERLGRTIQERQYLANGITIINDDRPASFDKRGEKYVTRTRRGVELVSDMLIVDIGILPTIELAESAGLKQRQGIVVDEYLRTSHPDVYAAGDNALFPCRALGKEMRVEHWDNAVAQGTTAGRNMAGSAVSYDYLPEFSSTLYRFSCRAVGEINAELQTVAEWEKENETGTVYYVGDGKLRGVLFCNREGNIDEARQRIRRGEVPQPLKAAVR